MSRYELIGTVGIGQDRYRISASDDSAKLAVEREARDLLGNPAWLMYTGPKSDVYEAYICSLRNGKPIIQGVLDIFQGKVVAVDPNTRNPSEECAEEARKVCRTCNVNLPISRYYISSVTPDGVSLHCKDCSAENKYQRLLRRNHRRQWDENEISIAREMRDGGAPCGDIGRRLGRTVKAVYQALHRYDLEQQNAGNWEA